TTTTSPSIPSRCRVSSAVVTQVPTVSASFRQGSTTDTSSAPAAAAPLPAGSLSENGFIEDSRRRYWPGPHRGWRHLEAIQQKGGGGWSRLEALAGAGGVGFRVDLRSEVGIGKRDRHRRRDAQRSDRRRPSPRSTPRTNRAPGVRSRPRYSGGP